MVKHTFTALIEDSLEALLKVFLTTKQAQAKLIRVEVDDSGIDNVKLLTMTVSVKPERAEWLKRKLFNLPVVLKVDYTISDTGLMKSMDA